MCACKEDKSEVQNAAAKTAALPVNVLEVAAEDVPLSFEFSARAQGYKETEVRARVSGILLKKNYIEGSEVREGDVLFEIDPKEYKARLNRPTWPRPRHSCGGPKPNGRESRSCSNSGW